MKTISIKRRTILIALGILLLLGIGTAGTVYYYLLAPQFFPAKKTYVYIDRDDTADSVYNKVSLAGAARSMRGFEWMSRYRDYGHHVRTGRYAISPEENVYHVFSRIYRGYQVPINLTIGSVRTLDRLSRSIGKQLMIDSAEIAPLWTDTLLHRRLGYDEATLPSLIVPDTYEVYWDMSADELIERIRKEHSRFWNRQRMAKAEALRMTPAEVCTLASIVEEETNHRPEMPAVAGMYLNRLRIGMPLQADPTVKFALNDFTLRRITNAHLTVDSPYNTYQNAGLPPGPIRIASATGIDAVLNYTPHKYLYMCAKEDFSGTHNFAVTYGEHIRNAQKYWKALNKRKIFK